MIKSLISKFGRARGGINFSPGVKCTEFDQKGNPFGIGGLSQKLNKGKRKISYEDTTPPPELAEMQEDLKSARLKLAEHDEENKRRDEEIKELRESHARVSELEKLLSFLKKDNPQIAAYMDEDSSDEPPPANDNN
ncbi:unnamed protein product [Arabis nemorensis]|uniref:Uncharacterized protein n=1 Tax=Arabis nemorensis TaxID=586526 RepID=A0A565BEG9_9BRAS|nr:unnamed protein product [Arabis nemorensis]